jgi:hypothetical protein
LVWNWNVTSRSSTVDLQSVYQVYGEARRIGGPGRT